MNIKIVKERNSLANAFADSLQTAESQVERSKLSIVEELCKFMKREGINRSELAERMNVPPSRITKMLSGDSNLTIDTLVRAGRAVGADLAQTFVPQGFAVRWHSFPKAAAAKDSVIGFPRPPTPVPQAPSPKIPSRTTAKKTKRASQESPHVAEPKGNYNPARKPKKSRKT